MDDDILVDLPRLLSKIRDQPEVDTKLFGYQHFRLPINRNGKWSVDRSELVNQDHFPDFLSGAEASFFKRIFAPTEKFAPTQYSAHAIVGAYSCRRREFAPMRVLKKLTSEIYSHPGK
jgi:hypothetical protein